MYSSKHSFFLSGHTHHPQAHIKLKPGSKLLDRFKIIRDIGHGRFGIVYHANDSALNEDVALKIIDSGHNQQSLNKIQLQNEIKNNKNILNFEHIIKVHDLHSINIDGTSMIILSMEYGDGGTYRDFLSETTNNHTKRHDMGIEYFLQGCQGVACAHDAGIIHLDLKPENLIFKNQILKVTDFGGAIHLNKISDSNKKLSSHPSEVGTPEYMSPERFIASGIDNLSPQSDIYSLGIILYELFHPNYKPPFTGTYSHIKNIHTKSISPDFSKIEGGYRHIIEKCLLRDPAKRYPTAYDLIEDISRLNNTNIGNPPRGNMAINMDSIFHEASTAFSLQKYDKATHILEQITEIDPHNKKAADLQSQINRRYNLAEECYREIQESIKSENKNLSDLGGMLLDAVKIYPDHPSGFLVQTKLAGLAKKYKQYVKESIEAIQQREWDLALILLKKAYAICADSSHIKHKIDILYQIKEMRAEIDEKISIGQFETALRIAKLIDFNAKKLLN